MANKLDDAFLSYNTLGSKLLLLLCCDWLILVRSVFGARFLLYLLLFMTIKHTLMFPVPSHLLYFFVMAIIPGVWCLRLFHRAFSPTLRMMYPDPWFNGLTSLDTASPRYKLLFLQPAMVVAIAVANANWQADVAAPFSMPWYFWWGSLAEIIAGNTQSPVILPTIKLLEETARYIIGTNFNMFTPSTAVWIATLHPFAGAVALYFHNRLDLAVLEAGGEDEIKKAKQQKQEAVKADHAKRHGDVSGPL